MEFISSPWFIAATFALAVGLLLYFLFVPRNDGRIVRTADSKGLSRLLGVLTNDIYQSLPVGTGQIEDSSKTESLIQRSGNPWNLNVYEFHYLKVILALVGALFGFIVGFGMKDALSFIPHVVWVIGFAVFGYFTPLMSYSSEASDRDDAFIRELPAALDLLIVSVHSGQSFQSAVRECVPLMRPGTVKETFQKLNISLASGKSLHQALDEFADTAPNDGIKTFVRSLQEANELNTPIIDTLQTRADASRQEYFSHIKQLASQLEIKMRLSMLITMIPALLILLIAPALVSFSTIM